MRAISYVDGFNLYFGLKSAGMRSLCWLDVAKLCADQLEPDCSLVATKYFTARISNDGGKGQRQTTYIEALSENCSIQVFQGTYRTKSVRCGKCHSNWLESAEKKTDVSIATQMLIDAYEDNCEHFLVVSGDSDLVPAVEAIRNRFPNKEVSMFFPPNRYTRELHQKANRGNTISKRQLEAAQLPPTVSRKRDGYALKCPDKWKE